MECVIQSSMFYSFYLFLSILPCNVDSALLSDSNAYIWISNCFQMFKLYSNVRIFIRMLKECVFSACSWKMASSDDEKKNIWKRKEISLLLLLSFLNPKISFFIGKIGGSVCDVCAERDVTQEGSREQTWQSVILVGRWVKKKGNFIVTLLSSRPLVKHQDGTFCENS